MVRALKTVEIKRAKRNAMGAAATGIALEVCVTICARACVYIYSHDSRMPLTIPFLRYKSTERGIW